MVCNIIVTLLRNTGVIISCTSYKSQRAEKENRSAPGMENKIICAIYFKNTYKNTVLFLAISSFYPGLSDLTHFLYSI